jgi:hypothetical protein
MCYSHLQPLDPVKIPIYGVTALQSESGVIGKDYFIKLDGDNETIWCYQSSSPSNKASDFNGERDRGLSE